MEKMQVRFERCKGCGLCVTVCPKQIVALQSTNVDTVSGATYSSVGLISAVRDALQKAGGSSASDSALPVLAASESQNKTGENAPAVEAIAEPAAYRDGVYTGTGTGRSQFPAGRSRIFRCFLPKMTAPICKMPVHCCKISLLPRAPMWTQFPVQRIVPPV